MVPPSQRIQHEELGADEEQAVAEAKLWLLQNGGRGISNEDVLAGFGLTLDDFHNIAKQRAARRQ